MFPKFDLFRLEGEGEVRWLEAAATLEHAKARIKELAAHVSGEYLILDQKTGAKLVIDCKMGETQEAHDPTSQVFRASFS
jgi:hypothetical protein